MALERARGGETIAAVAREISANESLVAQCVKDTGPPAKVQDAPQEFIEVLTRSDSAVNAASEPHCSITLGDARLSIPPGYPGSHLI